MLGLIFPGQGSQKIAMAKFLYDNFAIAKSTLEEASDILDQDLKTLIFEDPDQKLNLTENTQPCLLTASIMYFRSLKNAYDFSFQLSAGHSLGEYSAFVASGVLSFSDALILTKKRGQEMQKAVPLGEGAMLAVLGAKDEDVISACKNIKEVVEAANFNCPGQIVVSGSKAGVDAFKALDTKEIYGQKWKMIPLKVSAPFHSPLMKPAEKQMEAIILNTAMKKAASPIVQNFSAKEESEVENLKANLAKQISGPVRWTESVLRMKELGVQKLIELGPGNVLSGLVKKIDSEGIKPFNINNLDDFKAIESVLKDS